jgi:hypothetical protein
MSCRRRVECNITLTVVAFPLANQYVCAYQLLHRCPHDHELSYYPRLFLSLPFGFENTRVLKNRLVLKDPSIKSPSSFVLPNPVCYDKCNRQPYTELLILHWLLGLRLASSCFVDRQLASGGEKLYIYIFINFYLYEEECDKRTLIRTADSSQSFGGSPIFRQYVNIGASICVRKYCFRAGEFVSRIYEYLNCLKKLRSSEEYVAFILFTMAFSGGMRSIMSCVSSADSITLQAMSRKKWKTKNTRLQSYYYHGDFFITPFGDLSEYFVKLLLCLSFVSRLEAGTCST